MPTEIARPGTTNAPQDAVKNNNNEAMDLNILFWIPLYLYPNGGFVVVVAFVAAVVLCAFADA